MRQGDIEEHTMRPIDADELIEKVQAIPIKVHAIPFTTNDLIMADIVSRFRDKIVSTIDEQPTIMNQNVFQADDYNAGYSGAWIKHNGYYECNLCGSTDTAPDVYCPGCGATMRTTLNG